MNKQGAGLKNKRGYTLIEVVLFLSLTSAVSLIAFVGLGPRLRNVRFTSGMRSISDTITKQSANLNVGVNTGKGYKCTRVGSSSSAKPAIDANLTEVTGSSEGCVVSGRVFYFQTSRMTTYYITSLTQPKGGCITSTNMPQIDRLLCYAPYAFNGSGKPEAVQTNYPNGISFSGSVSDGNTRLEGSQAFGYLIDPDTNVRYQFVYGKTHGGFLVNNSPDPGSWGGIVQLGKDDLELSQSKTYCFKLGTRFAGLEITPNSTVPNLNFEDAVCRS